MPHSLLEDPHVKILFDFQQIWFSHSLISDINMLWPWPLTIIFYSWRVKIIRRCRCSSGADVTDVIQSFSAYPLSGAEGGQEKSLIFHKHSSQLFIWMTSDGKNSKCVLIQTKFKLNSNSNRIETILFPQQVTWMHSTAGSLISRHTLGIAPPFV